MIIIHDYDQIIDKADLQEVKTTKNDKEEQPISVNKIIPLKKALEETEKQLFLLAAKDGKSSYKVASLLDTSQPNAYRKMKKYLNT